MNSRPYRIITALLSLSLLAILLVQGFWLHNFYMQKADEFNKTVYQTLSEISAKLNERENLNFIREAALPKTRRKITKRGSSVKVIVSGASSSASGHVLHDMDIIKELRMDTAFGNERKVIISDSIMSVNHTNRQTVIVRNRISKSGRAKEDINQLLNKMLTEIKTIDVSPIEDIKDDSLKGIIKRTFETRGIFIPFEFVLKKEDKNTERIIAKSQKYNKNHKAYKADLSHNRVFTDHNYLYVQFPDEAGFVFSGIRNMLLLSVFFSLVIILVFYFTLKTVFKQKKLGEIKNDFINNMTHELKTPIATISLVIDALHNPQVKSDEEKFNKYTSILKEENQKLNNHVERVLQMALLDKSELQLHKKELNIIELIGSAITTHQLQIKKQHAKVIFDLQQPQVKITGDEFHLLNVFNNLLDNALKYSSQNCSIKITVQKNLNEIIIVIHDNGIGIDHALHEKVFERFYRVQSGNLHDVKGFGLGLSYVKSIIEKHNNGTIQLKSEKNKGSEFIIKLPGYAS